MQNSYTLDQLLLPLQRHLTRPQWQNLVALVVAVQLSGSLIRRQLCLFLVRAISSESCYRHLERMLQWDAQRRLQPLCRSWVRAVLRVFAPGRGRVTLLVDWTWHRDRCRSLWVMLPVGGRAVPLAFWLAPPETGGPGSQRKLEDRAFEDLRSWLPARRKGVLVGDRGFRGRDRMEFLRQPGLSFVLRISGETRLLRQGRWVPLRELRPALGQSWHEAGVLLGKELPGRVNLVVLRRPLLSPKRLRDNQGKLTDQVAEDTTWYLATDLPLSVDIAAV